MNVVVLFFPMREIAQQEGFWRQATWRCLFKCGGSSAGISVGGVPSIACMSSLQGTLRGTMQTLSVDGWSNPVNVPLVGFCLGAHLVELVEERSSHTSEMLATMATNHIELLQEKFQCQIVAIVTDGASNMTGMRGLVASRKPVLGSSFFLIPSQMQCLTEWCVFICTII